MLPSRQISPVRISFFILDASSPAMVSHKRSPVKTKLQPNILWVTAPGLGMTASSSTTSGRVRRA
jgi:hypothetical protein